MLYELRYPGSALEQDSGTVTSHSEGWGPYGRVAYTHAGGIDRPIGMIRMNYNYGSGGTVTNTWQAPQLVVPHVDWKGRFDIGSVTAGSFVDGGLNKVCGSPSQLNTCFLITWPAPLSFAGARLNTMSLFLPLGWMGSLKDNHRDASGQVYQRNRYYDPGTGRFTQEDPIGLAGGLNLYGFASGDPVNFSDPFGLPALRGRLRDLRGRFVALRRC